MLGMVGYESCVYEAARSAGAKRIAVVDGVKAGVRLLAGLASTNCMRSL